MTWRSFEIVGFGHVIEVLLQFHDDPMRGLDFVDSQPIGKAVDPRRLKDHGSIECLPAFVGQNDKLCAAMVRIRLETNQTVCCQVVHDSLDILTIGPQVPGDPRDGLRPLCCRDGAKHLPARAREPEFRNQAVPRGQQSAVEPVKTKKDGGQAFACGRSRSLAHMSPYVSIDMMMSIYYKSGIPC